MNGNFKQTIVSHGQMLYRLEHSNSPVNSQYIRKIKYWILVYKTVKAMSLECAEKCLLCI